MRVSDAKPGQVLRPHGYDWFVVLLTCDAGISEDPRQRWWRVLNCLTGSSMLFAESKTPYFASVEDSELVVDV